MVTRAAACTVHVEHAAGLESQDFLRLLLQKRVHRHLGGRQLCGKYRLRASGCTLKYQPMSKPLECVILRLL